MKRVHSSMKYMQDVIFTDYIPTQHLNEIISAAGKNLQNIRLFDLYRGEQVGSNKKSLAYSLEFSAIDKTLNEKDIEFLIKKISERLLKKFNAKLRDQQDKINKFF